MTTIKPYDPIVEVERAAHRLSDMGLCDLSVDMMVAATAMRVLIDRLTRDDVDRAALAAHWVEHDADGA